MTGLVTPLPLIKGISNRICFGIIDYFTQQNEWTKKVFGSAQYVYDKDDLASVQRPSLFCLPIYSNKTSFSHSVNGQIVMQLQFSLKDKRINLTNIATEISELILLIIVNQTITKYLQDNVMNGLFWVGKETNIDYSGLYGGNAEVKILLDYKVDLQAYQYELNSKGFDIVSPDEKIYQLAQFLKMDNQLIKN